MGESLFETDRSGGKLSLFCGVAVLVGESLSVGNACREVSLWLFCSFGSGKKEHPSASLVLIRQYPSADFAVFIHPSALSVAKSLIFRHFPAHNLPCIAYIGSV